MHEYTIEHHDRKNVYYIVALFSGVIGIVVASLIVHISSWSGITVAAPSGIAIFGLTFILFDQFLWKFSIFYRFGLIKIPNLNGSWDILMESSHQKDQINAKLYIHQTYTKIRTRLETNKSQSLSTMASIKMLDPNCFDLRYEYLAEFQDPADKTIKRHYGVTRISLTSNDSSFSDTQTASYYTEEITRDTHGIFHLTKTE